MVQRVAQVHDVFPQFVEREVLVPILVVLEQVVQLLRDETVLLVALRELQRREFAQVEEAVAVLVRLVERLAQQRLSEAIVKEFLDAMGGFGCSLAARTTL